MYDEQPDEVINADKAEELMEDVLPETTTLRFQERKIILEDDKKDLTVSMISTREDPTLIVDARGKGMVTVSRFIIEKDGTVYEREGHGPFTVTLPGFIHVAP
jgi:hypothetical protein